MKLIFCILFCGFTHISMATNKVNIDSLVKLGRDSLIKIAAKKINDEKFNSDNYDRITVKYNNTDLIVEFQLAVTVKGGNDCYYDAVSVSVVKGLTSKSIIGDCDEPKFYTAPKSDKKTIQFVFDAINKSDEVGDIKDNKLSPGNTMEISEHATYYYVEVSSWSTYSHYKVHKITGKITDANHKHYARNSKEENEWKFLGAD